MAALLTAQNCTGNVHLIVGSGPLAASRCTKSLEVGALPTLICPEDDDIHYTLLKLIETGKVRWTKTDFEDEDLTRHGRQEVDCFVDAVFVTRGPRHPLSLHISRLCKKMRIPVNVVDAPQLCTFTLLSTYTDGPLQIGITTSGRGCKLSARIRREIAASLPSNFGSAIERLGTVRRKIWEEDQAALKGLENISIDTQPHIETSVLDAEDEDSTNQKHTFNTLIETSSTDPAIARTRRMRWLSQICEYWPLRRLADITDADISAILEAYKSTAPETISTAQDHIGNANNDAQVPQIGYESIQDLRKRKGTITLAGSGPGHPSLLTLATHSALQSAHYILADKLVPAEILALIPRRTPVHIARKFPGNADAAQEELLNLSLAAMEEGRDVLRLKQGDPYLYGRGAEEVSFFRQHGYEARVLPGVTSALSAPLFAGIPVTHRAVADQVIVCTGTGRKGAAPIPPSFKPNKTIVFLMALHRLESLIKSLVEPAEGFVADPVETREAVQRSPTQRTSRIWPKTTPCTVIERASCPDQRVIRSSLEHISQAVQEEGSRPPGLLVVGAACTVLHSIPEGQRWTVEEGFRGLDETVLSASSTSIDMITQMQKLDQIAATTTTTTTTTTIPYDPKSTLKQIPTSSQPSIYKSAIPTHEGITDASMVMVPEVS